MVYCIVSYNNNLCVSNILAFISGHKIEFDELLSKHIGEFGYYQKVLFFIIASEMIFTCFHVMSPVFLALTPPFHCSLPDVPSGNISYQQLKVGI